MIFSRSLVISTLQLTALQRTACMMCSWCLFNSALQHTATHCNTLHHTANPMTNGGWLSTLRTATHCNILHHTWYAADVYWLAPCNTLHCNTLQHTATQCNTMQPIATHMTCRFCLSTSELQHTALQHIALQYTLIERNPPPGGVSYLLCSLMKNWEEEDPPWRTTPKIDQFWGWFSRGGPLPPGSWSGNIMNRKPPRGGGVLSIKLNTLQYTWYAAGSIHQRTATQCNTVQHTATHYKTLQRTVMHCNRLPRHTARVDRHAVCCSVLQCVAVCCSVLQCVAVCCSALGNRQQLHIMCVAVCCSVLRCVAVCCSALVNRHQLHIMCVQCAFV